MKKVITFALQKGGVGKTSISVSVAVALAQNNYRVLLIDSDPQGNATTWLDIQEMKLELADVLMKKCSAKEAILPTKVENLSIIPTAALGSDLRVYSKTYATQQPFVVRHLVKELKSDYDYIVIDTSPAFGALEESCLLASDEAITVLNIDEFSTDGLITFYQNIESLRERYDTEKPLMNKIVLNGRDLRLSQQNDYLQRMETTAEQSNMKLYIVPVDQAFKKAHGVLGSEPFKCRKHKLPVSRYILHYLFLGAVVSNVASALSGYPQFFSAFGRMLRQENAFTLPS